MTLESHSHEIQHKRFEKGTLHSEIQMLSSLSNVKTNPRKSPFGLIIRIVFPKPLLHSSDIVFDLYLEGKFPFQSPKLLSESQFAFPSVSDGRDLLSVILPQKWTPSITSAEIISLLPSFVKSTLLSVQEDLPHRDFGKFHLGSPYSLEIWSQKEGMGVLLCTEKDMKNVNYIKDRAIAVTHTVILVFELNEENPGIGYLLSWATLQSLNLIKRSRQDPERLTFEWRQIGDSPPCCQEFRVPQASDLIDLITRNMKKVWAINKKNAGQTIREDEVNGNVIKSVDIDSLMAKVEEGESELEKEVTLERVNCLLMAYQQAVEYYAAVGDGNFDRLLRKMHRMMADERVLMVMQGRGTEEKKEREDSRKGEEEEKARNYEEKKDEEGKKEIEKEEEVGGEELEDDRKQKDEAETE
jgi:ubiquitin-protein ligase